MTMMRCLLKTEHGVVLTQLPIPECKNDNDVCIKVSLAGLCRTDMDVATNKHSIQQSPLILGHEFSGAVQSKGSAVTHLNEGDRVGVMPLYWNDGEWIQLGVHRDGAFAEYVVVPDTQVHKVPDNVSDREAAYLEPIAASLGVIKPNAFNMKKTMIWGDNRIAKLTQRIIMCKETETNVIIHSEKDPPLADTYDVAIETICNEESMAQLVSAIKAKGTLILKSRPVSTVGMPVIDIVRKEIQLQGAYYGDLEEGINLLGHKLLTIEDLFGPTLSLEAAIPILTGQVPITEDKKIFIQPGT